MCECVMHTYASLASCRSTYANVYLLIDASLVCIYVCVCECVMHKYASLASCRKKYANVYLLMDASQVCMYVFACMYILIPTYGHMYVDAYVCTRADIPQNQILPSLYLHVCMYMLTYVHMQI
jgi:hypothetical protein